MATVKQIFERIRELFLKILSLKVIIFILATILMFNKLIESWMWWSFGVSVISIRAFEKLIDRGGFK